MISVVCRFIHQLVYKCFLPDSISAVKLLRMWFLCFAPVYPTPLISVRFRESVFRETGHTIMNLLAVSTEAPAVNVVLACHHLLCGPNSSAGTSLSS